MRQKMDKTIEKADQNLIDEIYSTYGQSGKQTGRSRKNKNEENILNRLVIPVDCEWKKVFYNIIMLLSVINVF